jgi:SAM-dependent methyltransferase
MNPSTYESSTWTTYRRLHGHHAADPRRFHELMRHPDYPRASAYDPTWVHHNLMGPNSLWLLDGLTRVADLSGCNRVLDLGCGTAITSIFLARELGLEVWAADLWIEPSANWERIEEAGVAGQVHPIEAEAHRLPFAAGFFDAVASIDAYHYFGTDVRYLSYLAQFVRTDGIIAIVVPGNSVDPDDRPDDVTGPFPELHGADWFTFRSAAWWERHWRRTRCIEVERAEMVPDGWDLWWRFQQAGAAWSGDDPAAVHDGPMLLAEAGRSLEFVRVVARRLEGVPLVFGPDQYTTRLA